LEEKVQNHRVYKINFEEIKKILKTKKQKQKLDRSKMFLKPQTAKGTMAIRKETFRRNYKQLKRNRQN
jgi:hypothetical protein